MDKKRLIDANAFEQAHCLECPYMLKGLCTKDDPMCSTIDDLRGFPSVDATEVVHGRWLSEMHGNSNNGTCSVCGSYKHAYAFEWKYCPFCGAKMDGDGNG